MSHLTVMALDHHCKYIVLDCWFSLGEWYLTALQIHTNWPPFWQPYIWFPWLHQEEVGLAVLPDRRQGVCLGAAIK